MKISSQNQPAKPGKNTRYCTVLYTLYDSKATNPPAYMERRVTSAVSEAANGSGVHSHHVKGQGMAGGLGKDDLSRYMWRSSLMRSRTAAVPSYRKDVCLPYIIGHAPCPEVSTAGGWIAA